MLQDRRAATSTLVAAIDGGGGAGKSTLADAISGVFGAGIAIIRGDDFYRPSRDAEDSSTAQLAYENYFDWRRLRDDALTPLRDGSIAKYQRYDWSTDSLAEWIEIAPTEIVIVEGVYSMRPELREFIDVAIFIDTPRDERMRRMLARSQNSTAWIERWMAAEDWYFEHLEPAKHADLVIPGF